jgi:hypothetical protein
MYGTVTSRSTTAPNHAFCHTDDVTGTGSCKYSIEGIKTSATLISGVLARCAFSDRNLHSRMPLDPTHVRLKLLHACDQWHSSRKFTPLTGLHCKFRPTTEGPLTLTYGNYTKGVAPFRIYAWNNVVRCSLCCMIVASSKDVVEHCDTRVFRACSHRAFDANSPPLGCPPPPLSLSLSLSLVYIAVALLLSPVGH